MTTLVKQFKKDDMAQDLALAHEFLKSINTHNEPDAYIAGGCPRDIINDKPYKDIDIFIRTASIMDCIEKSFLIKDFCALHGLDLEVTGEYGGTRRNEIKTVLKAGNMEFILTDWFNKPEDLIKGFDSVLSEAWLEWAPDWFRVRCSELFFELNDRKINASYSKHKTEHFKRIEQKYSDYLPLSIRGADVSHNRPVDTDIPF